MYVSLENPFLCYSGALLWRALQNPNLSMVLHTPALPLCSRPAQSVQLNPGQPMKSKELESQLICAYAKLKLRYWLCWYLSETRFWSLHNQIFTCFERENSSFSFSFPAEQTSYGLWLCQIKQSYASLVQKKRCPKTIISNKIEFLLEKQQPAGVEIVTLRKTLKRTVNRNWINLASNTNKRVSPNGDGGLLHGPRVGQCVWRVITATVAK